MSRMKKAFGALVVALLVLVAAPLQAAMTVHPFATEYTVHYNGLKVGEMKQRLEKRDNGTYLLETVVYTTGFVSWFKKDRITERSIWRYVDGEVQPLQYTYHYKGRSKDVVEKVDFDWDKMEAKALTDGKVTRLPLKPGTYDKQSYQIKLRHDIDAGKKVFHYDVANRSKIRDFDLKVVGRERVMTPSGKVDTVMVKKGTTTLWLAQKHNYTVVKIEQDEDGNLATSYITSKLP